MNAAYGYGAQRWVTGTDGAALRRRQLEDELALVTGPTGADYLRFVGSPDSPATAAARIRALLAEVQS